MEPAAESSGFLEHASEGSGILFLACLALEQKVLTERRHTESRRETLAREREREGSWKQGCHETGYSL